jgi:hypothetical protein
VLKVAIFLFIYFSNITFLIYGMISKTVPFAHTEPCGKPAAAVGIFIIDRLFTNVVQVRLAVMFEPTIIASEVPAIFWLPPKIADL